MNRGADTSVRDELHFTPLLTAADGGNIDTLRVLLEEGAETGNLGELELFHWTVKENKPDVLKVRTNCCNNFILQGMSAVFGYAWEQVPPPFLMLPLD